MFGRIDHEQKIAFHHVAVGEGPLRHQGSGDFGVAFAGSVGETVDAFIHYEFDRERHVFREAFLYDVRDDYLERKEPFRPFVALEFFAAIINVLRKLVRYFQKLYLYSYIGVFNIIDEVL